MVIRQFLAWGALALALGCDSNTSAPAPTPTRAPAPAQRPVLQRQVTAQGQLGPGRGTLVIDLEAAPGRELSEGAPLRIHATGTDLTFPESIQTELHKQRLPLRLPIVVSDGALGPARLSLSYYTCNHGQDASCQPERTELTVELDLSGSSDGGEAHLTHKAGS